jgi:hypothetical protein
MFYEVKKGRGVEGVVGYVKKTLITKSEEATAGYLAGRGF